MPTTLRGHTAGFVSRLLAYTIDILVIVVTLVFIVWLVETVSRMFQLAVLQDFAAIIQIIITSVAIIFIAAIYFIFFWTLTGQTPGKMLLGVRVVNREGQEITFWQAVRRYIGYYISAFALYIGFIWVLFDNQRQAWHDKLAGTYVIYTWDARPGAKMATYLEKRQTADQGTEEPVEQA